MDKEIFEAECHLIQYLTYQQKHQRKCASVSINADFS